MVGVPSMLPEGSELGQIKALERSGFNAAILLMEAQSEDEEGYVRWALEQVQSKKSASIAFPQDFVRLKGGEDRPAERWATRQAKHDPVATARWREYKKSRDYQIKCQVWGQVGGC